MKKHIKIFSLIIILIIADQLTKLWALADLRGSEGIPVISGVFELQYLENRGAAFGILQDKQILFLLITVAVAVLLTYIYIRIPEERKYTPLRICYVLLMAGAFGNLIDRVARGYVVDFFYFKLIDFPIFNVADIYVTVTMVLLIGLILFYYKEEDFEFLSRKGNMDETIEIKVTSDLAGKRLDVILAEQCDDLTRSYINKLCKEERAKLNDKISKGNKKCKEGDKITLQIPEPEELEILPEKMDLDIVYEDQDVILINKPKNMVVHPAAGHYTGTLVNGLMAHCKDDLSGINGVLRPGIVHRIDKDTTGILIVCKNDMAHQSIAKQLYDHSITRKYHAIVYGNIKEEEGTVNAPIGRSLKDRKKMGIVMDGKHAVTHYKVLRRLKKGFTYIECQLETGRTHQIRVHMASIKHPLLGDDVYGPKKSKYTLEGQCLHAKVLGFVHPRTGEYMEFEVPLPEYFEKLLKKLDQ